MVASSVSILAAVASLLAAAIATLAWRASERSIRLQWVAQREERIATLVAALRVLADPSASSIHLDESMERESEEEEERPVLSTGVGSYIVVPTPDWVHQDRRQRWADTWRELDHAVYRARSALVGTIHLPRAEVVALDALLTEISKGPTRAHLEELGERIAVARGWLNEVHAEAVGLVAPRHYRRAISRAATRLCPSRLVHWTRDRVKRRPK